MQVIKKLNQAPLVLTLFLGLGCGSALAQSSSSGSSASQRFVTAAAYGTIAGSALGLGKMLIGSGGKKNIAVGASLGLYAGIIYGAYSAYAGGASAPGDGKSSPEKGPAAPKENYDPSDPLGIGAPKSGALNLRTPRFVHQPLVAYTDRWEIGYQLEF